MSGKIQRSLKHILIEYEFYKIQIFPVLTVGTYYKAI